VSNDQFFIQISEDKWNQADDGFFTPPLGLYEFHIENAETDVVGTKTALRVTCVIAKGEYAGRKIGRQNYFLTEAAAWRIKRLARAVGVDIVIGGGGVRGSANDFIGQRFLASVEHETVERDGKTVTYTRLNNEAPIAGEAEQPQQPQQSRAQAPVPQPLKMHDRAMPATGAGYPAPQQVTPGVVPQRVRRALPGQA
jgi:hypothetical protein